MQIKKKKVGWKELFLLLLTILFLTSCSTREKIVPQKVSPHLLEDCPMPTRKRYSNKYLRAYTVELHKSLLKCNADKKAIRTELGQ